MTFPLGVQLAVLVLGVARLTVLVTSDRITRGFRYRIERRYGRESYPGTLVRCPWCAGYWIALACAVAYVNRPAGTTIALLPWAVAMLASPIAGYLAPNDDPPVLDPLPNHFVTGGPVFGAPGIKVHDPGSIDR